jgi:phage portal protein BeeE
VGLLSYLRGTDVVEDRAHDAVAPDQRSLPAAENQLPLWSAWSPTNITPIGALAIADVWAAVRALADAVSSLPLHVYRRRDDGARERVTSGKLADLLERPGPGTSQADLVSSLMAHLANLRQRLPGQVPRGW